MFSGDDGITLPLLALGGRGLISVVSNEIPGEMTRMVQLALANDFASAREVQRRYFKLMEVNFVETNPTPVKAGMALMGLCERVPPAAGAGQTGKSLEDCGVLDSLGLIHRSMLRAENREIVRRESGAVLPRTSGPVSKFKNALNAGEIRAAEPDASAKTGWRVNAWVKKGILLGFRMGATVDMSIDAARQPFSTSRPIQ